MQKYNFVLSLFLLLSERPFYCGTTMTMEAEEASGSSHPLSTTVVITHATISTVFSTSNQDLEAATMLTETETFENDSNSTTEMNAEQGGLQTALIFGAPAALLLGILILLVIFIVRRHKQKQSKQDELESENCKSPIFEEDTPSVMEIEMEELDKWMNSLKRNAECEYLPPVKEEKDCNANPSDCES